MSKWKCWTLADEVNKLAMSSDVLTKSDVIIDGFESDWSDDDELTV